MTDGRFDQRGQSVGPQVNIAAIHTVAPKRDWSKLGISTLIVILIALIAGGLFFLHQRWLADIDLSGDSALSAPRTMQVGQIHEITLEGYPFRPYLRLTPILENPSDVGDCVEPARIDILGGRADTPLTARSGETVTVPLAEKSTVIKLTLTIRVPDKECRVALTISGAALHR